MNFDEYENKWIELVSTHKCQLELCPQQTPNICMAAVKFDGFALKFVENQTYDICRNAVISNSYSINFVKKQTEDLCKIAIEQAPVTIQYIRSENLTEELIEMALAIDPSVVRFLKHTLTKKQWVKALRNTYGHMALEYVPFQLRKETLDKTISHFEKEELREKVESLK